MVRSRWARAFGGAGDAAVRPRSSASEHDQVLIRRGASAVGSVLRPSFGRCGVQPDGRRSSRSRRVSPLGASVSPHTSPGTCAVTHREPGPADATGHHRGASPSRSRGHHAWAVMLGGRRDDEPLEEVDAEIVGEVAGLQPAVIVALDRPAARADGRHDDAPGAPGGGDRPGDALDDVEHRVGLGVPSTTTTVRPGDRGRGRGRSSRRSAGGASPGAMTASAAAALSIGSMPARGGRWAAQNMDMDPSPVGVGGVEGDVGSSDVTEGVSQRTGREPGVSERGRRARRPRRRRPGDDHERTAIEVRRR